MIFSGQYCILCNLVSARVLENDELQIVDGINGCPFGSGDDQLGTADWVWIVRLDMFQYRYEVGRLVFIHLAFVRWL